MSENVLNTIKDLEIKKAPEENSQEAANQLYTKKQLAYFIERYDLDIAKSWKKAEIVSALTEWMNTAGKELLESDSDLASLLSKVSVEASFDLYNGSVPSKEMEQLLLLIEHGFAYNVDGQIWLPETAEAAANESASDSAKPAQPKTEAKNEKAPTSQATDWSRPAQPAPALTAQEKIARNKQARLEYFKKQAKKKKRK